MDRGSVSHWIDALKEGDAEAADKLWRRYSPIVLRFAESRLAPHTRRFSDEEDIALSAFTVLCIGAAEHRFPNLHDRHDLWRLLITFVRQKVADHNRTASRKKRGAGQVRGDSAIQLSRKINPVGSVVGTRSAEPTPDVLVALQDEYEHVMRSLKDQTIRQIAQRKLEGATNLEIAKSLNVSVRTIERKLSLIKEQWQALMNN